MCDIVHSNVSQEILVQAPTTRDVNDGFSFEVAVKGLARHDVCRAFLATLQVHILTLHTYIH